MAFQFPASPTLGQLFTPIAGVTYQYDGVGWAPYLSSAPTIPSPFIHRNRIKNGSFHLDTIRKGLTVYSGLGRALDYWNIGGLASNGTFTIQRVADPDDATRFAMKVGVSVADAAITSADLYTINHYINSVDVQDLLIGTPQAKTVVISFDMKFSVVGAYTIGLRNGSGSRSYVTTVNQLVANATEHKTIVVPMDTSAAWIMYEELYAITLLFNLGGAALVAPSLNQWIDGNFTTAATQANFLSSVGNIGYLKNFQLERGTIETAFDNSRSDGLVPVDDIQYRSQPFRNRVLNGDFRFDQINENGLYLVNAANKQTLDGWSGTAIGTGTYNVNRNNNVTATYNETGLQAAVAVAQPAIGAGDAFYIYHTIEGYDAADFRSGFAVSEIITVSFIMQSAVPGIYGVSIHNAAFDRVYVAPITISAANTPEYKSITFAADLAGAWPNINNAGMSIVICLACGTNFQTAPNVWSAGNLFSVAGQANYMATVGNIFILRSVQVEKGPYATPFERLPYNKALARVQRYYEKSFSLGIAVAENSGSGSGTAAYHSLFASTIGHTAPVTFAVNKRAIPTITFYNPVALNAKWHDASIATDSGVPTAYLYSNRGFLAFNPQVGSDPAGAQCFIHWSANARLS